MAPRPIIYINSWPGAGKHTIAKALAQLFGDGARVVRSTISPGNYRPLTNSPPENQVHNHLHIDLADAILPRSSPDYQALRHQLRSALFRTLVNSPDTHDTIYIFTDFQSTNELGPSVAREYEAAARARGCLFVPVILSCDGEENARRMTSEERVDLVEKQGKGMLLDTKILEDMRSRVDVYRFDCEEQLEMDVTTVTPEWAAGFVFDHVVGLM